MFKLERAIGEWKKSTRKKQAIQDADLVELESYLRDKIDDLVSHRISEEDAFRKAESEFVRAEKRAGLNRIPAGWIRELN